MSMDRREILILSAATTLATAGLASSGSAIAAPEEPSPDFHGLTGLNIPKQMTVIGTGGSGCWPALFAALAGVPEMLLLDASDVSADDLGRTFFRSEDIGKPKSVALAEILKYFRPNISVRTVKKFVEPSDTDFYFGTVIFDGVDYPPLNKAIPVEAKKRGMVYTQGFYKGLDAGVASHSPDDINWSHGPGPVWTGSAAFSGILQLYSAFVSPFNFYGSPSDGKRVMSDEDMDKIFLAGEYRK